MATIEIRDEDTLKALSTAIKLLVEKNSDYFFSQLSYGLNNTITDLIRKAIEQIVREQITIILEEQKIKEQVKEVLATKFGNDEVQALMRKINIRIDGY